MTESPLSLEQRMARLDAILGRLESDGLELDEALALFEEGVAHVREAEGLLREAELKIERLVAGPGGTTATEPVPGETG